MINLRFLHTFLDIALWRKGPQDLPASPPFTLLALLAYLAVAFVRMRLFQIDPQDALLSASIDALMLGIWLWLLLVFFGRRQRFAQTLLATLGVGLLILLFDIAARGLCQMAGLDEQQMVSLLRRIVTALVLGRILMLALDRGLITGIALTLAIVFSTNFVVVLMLEMRG